MGHPRLLRSHRDFGVWRTVFAVLIIAVICDAVAIWMGWLTVH